MKKYKVLFCDLDGTLIDTITSKCESCTNNTSICADIDCTKYIKSDFPKGIWDMKFKFDVLDAIKKLNPEYVFIVSNQGGIEKGFVNKRNFEFKMEYIIRSIKEYLGYDVLVEYRYCPFNDKDNQYRKPNIGMLVQLSEKYIQKNNPSPSMCNNDFLMIGDASGLDGQFSDSDKMTAENFGIDYLDVNEFVERYNK